MKHKEERLEKLDASMDTYRGTAVYLKAYGRSWLYSELHLFREWPCLQLPGLCIGRLDCQELHSLIFCFFRQ